MTTKDVKNWESPTTVTPGVEDVSLDEMDYATKLALWRVYQEDIEQTRAKQSEVKAAIHRQMQNDEALEVPHPEIECRITFTTTYDQDALRPLLESEALTDEVRDEGYKQPWTETIDHPGAFNMTKVLPWKKYGKTVADVIERATHKDPSGLSIKIRKGK